MSNQRTPGPFNISKHATPEHSPQFGIHAGEGRDIATIKGPNAKADATLFHAAPEMLEALRYVAEFGTTEPMSASVARLVNTAITKATL